MSGKSDLRQALPLAALLVLLAGCAVNNNFLRPEDFADRLRRDGVTVESVRELPPQPFRATSGSAIKIAGSEIGVYKFEESRETSDPRKHPKVQVSIPTRKPTQSKQEVT